MAERYPLEPARVLRAHAEDDAQASLAAALAEQERARTARQAALAALEAHRSASFVAFEPTTAAQLHREEALRTRRGEQEAALVGELRRALADERAARERVDAARAALTQALAERKVIERHHEGWQQARERAREKSREDELDDLAAARAKKP